MDVVKYNSLKLFKLFYALGLLWVSAVIYLSTTSSPPDTSEIAFGDKIFHTLGYFCLFYWFGQIYKHQYFYRPAAALIAMGIILEFVQYQLGYRTLEIADMVANTSGVLIGWLVARYIYSGWFIFFEKQIFPDKV